MPAQRSSVLFHIPVEGISRRNLRDFATRLQSEVAEGRAFDVMLTSDAELQRLNREFRKKDYVTDVLSFPCATGPVKKRLWPPRTAGETACPTTERSFLGELAISIDRARTQAEEHGHAPQLEIEILMLHGVLHLLGMDHEKDGGQMARAERRWRKHFALPAGLIERVRA